jgi:hypothetical protein
MTPEKRNQIMKTGILVLAATLCCFAQASKPAPKKNTASKPAEITLPKDAKQISPNQWSWTDAQGKHWMYNKTPFGLTRVESQAAATPAAPSTEGFSVVESGDRAKITRRTPFGVYTSEKPIEELNEVERAALAESRRKQAKNEKK